MTHLSFNDSRYIAMNNGQQISSGLDKVNGIEILGKIRPVFFLLFDQVVDDCCMRIDLEFGLQLGKIREKLSKDQFIKQLEYVRSVRREIKQNYLLKVNSFFDDPHIGNNQGGEFDLVKASLIGEDARKENHAITLIIRQCERLFYEDLIALNKKFAFRYGKQTIADSQNPIFPEKLIRAMAEIVNPLKLNADAKIALYKVFEVNVFKQLGFIYGELMTRCESASTVKPAAGGQQRSMPSSRPLYPVVESKEQAESVSANTEQPSAEFKQLQKKLGLWRLAHFPSAYDLISTAGNVFYEQVEIKNALQALQPADPGEKKQPLKWRLAKKLEELSFSIDAISLAKDDEDVLDLVALIFSEIERDELLQDTVKTAILQLEIPLAAALLGRYSAFTCQGNPVRQLLDDLFVAGMFLNPDEYDDQLIQGRISSVVKKMVNDNGFEFSGWTAEADEFSNYMTKQKQRSQRVEEKARQFMENKQTLALSRKMVATAIENSMSGKKLPTAIVEFLRDVWRDVLLDAYARRDEQPEQWARSVQAMDELIVSVIPPADDHQRKQVLKLLPGLIAELRNGLKRISYDKSAQSRFFKDLAVWHIILMDKKEAGKAVDYIGKDSAGTVEVDKAIEDGSLEQAENLVLESWVAFGSESGKQWGKLLWKDAETGVMLFVGKNGAKIFEIQSDEFAEKLRKQQAAIVKMDNKTISERVLSELMSL